METTLHAHQTRSHSKGITEPISKSHAVTKQLSPFWQMVEFNRYGIIAMLVLVISGMGGIAAGFGTGYDPLRLSLTAFPAAIALSLVLAVAPMKWIVWSTVIAFIIDCLLLIF